MGTQLFEGKKFTLYRFWGGGERGIMYQITQHNKTEKYCNWIQLSEKDLQFIVRRIKKCHI